MTKDEEIADLKRRLARAERRLKNRREYLKLYMRKWRAKRRAQK